MNTFVFLFKACSVRSHMSACARIPAHTLAHIYFSPLLHCVIIALFLQTKSFQLHLFMVFNLLPLFILLLHTANYDGIPPIQPPGNVVEGEGKDFYHSPINSINRITYKRRKAIAFPRRNAMAFLRLYACPPPIIAQ